MTSYSDLLRDPRWQKKRLEILSRDDFTCMNCADTTNTLHVHHRYYLNGHKPWEYPDTALTTLCADCHEQETADLKPAKNEIFLAFARRGQCAGALSYIAQAFEEEAFYEAFSLLMYAYTLRKDLHGVRDCLADHLETTIFSRSQRSIATIHQPSQETSPCQSIA